MKYSYIFLVISFSGLQSIFQIFPPTLFSPVFRSPRVLLSSLSQEELWILSLVFSLCRPPSSTSVEAPCWIRSLIPEGPAAGQSILISFLSASSGRNCSSLCPAGCCRYRTSSFAWCWPGGLLVVGHFKLRPPAVQTDRKTGEGGGGEMKGCHVT